MQGFNSQKEVSVWLNNREPKKLLGKEASWCKGALGKAVFGFLIISEESGSINIEHPNRMGTICYLWKEYSITFKRHKNFSFNMKF